MKPRIFVGSSSEAIDIAYAAQKALSDAGEVVVWSQGVFRSIHVPIESLMAAIKRFDFAVFILRPDDVVTIRDDEKECVRDNVVFELGMFLGRLGRERIFFISPEGVTPDKLHLPSDFTGITPAHYNPSAVPLQSSVNAALYELRESIRRLNENNDSPGMLYDGTREMKPYHFTHRNGYMYKDSQPASPKSRGSLEFVREGGFKVQRRSVEGRYEVELRANGPEAPTIPKKHDPLFRVIRLSCEVRVDRGEHKIRFVLKDIVAGRWAANESKKIKNTEWQPIDLYFRVSPDADLLFRIDDEIPSESPSNVYIRKLLITEEPTTNR